MKTTLIRAVAAVVPIVGGAASAWSPQDEPQAAKKDPPRLWVYRDVPGPDEVDERTTVEKEVIPFFVFPASGVDRVVINDRLAASTLDEDTTGTVLEVGFRLVGAGDFLGVKFIPFGKDPGEHPGIDVKRTLFLDPQKPVALKFRARTADGAEAHVVFQLGGTAGRHYSDSLRFPEVVKPKPSRLDDEWREFTVDLEGKDLTSVLNPLTIIARSDDNRGVPDITVFVDDLRFEIEMPKPKPDKKPADDGRNGGGRR